MEFPIDLLLVEMERARELARVSGGELREAAVFAWEAALDESLVAASLGALGLLAAWLARRTTLLLAALLIAGFVLALSQSGAPTSREVILVLGVLTQLTLAITALTLRREQRALCRQTRDLQGERQKLQDQLDREIRWRMAADECHR